MDECVSCGTCACAGDAWVVKCVPGVTCRDLVSLVRGCTMPHLCLGACREREAHIIHAPTIRVDTYTIHAHSTQE